MATAPAADPVRTLIDLAFADILRGDFESEAVHAVMGRRSGTIDEYLRMRGLYDAAVQVAIHSGAR